MSTPVRLRRGTGPNTRCVPAERRLLTRSLTNTSSALLMPMCPARIENIYSTLPRPEVQPDANRFSDRGCGNAKAAPGRRDSRRSGKFVGVVHIASTASDVSAVINYVDDRVADNDDTIAQPNVDAAANMDPAANMDTAGANGGTAAEYRPH